MTMSTDQLIMFITILVLAGLLQAAYRVLLYPLVDIAKAAVRGDLHTVHTTLLSRPVKYLRSRVGDYAYLLYISGMKTEAAEIFTAYSLPIDDRTRLYIETIEAVERRDATEADRILTLIDKKAGSVPDYFALSMRELITRQQTTEEDLTTFFEQERKVLLQKQKALMYVPILNLFGTVVLVSFAFVFGYYIQY